MAVYISACLLLPLLTDFGLMEFIGTLARPIFQRAFKLPGRAAIDALASFVGATAIGLLITIGQYNRGFYTERDASVIATNFSVVSIPFSLVVATVAGIGHLFIVWYAVVIAACLLAALITPRLPPLSRKPDVYAIESADTAMEEQTAGQSLLSEAWRRAQQRALQAPGPRAFIESGIKNLLFFVFSVIPAAMAVATIAAILTFHTPVFAWLGYPFIMVLEFAGVPDAAVASVGLFAGFMDQYMPAVIASRIDSEVSSFVLAGLAVCQLIFMSEVGVIILRSSLPISLFQLAVIFLQRTIIVTPVLIAGAHLFACADTTRDSASLAIENARVWTGDSAKPWAEAVAVQGDRILAVGGSAEIADLIGEDTQVIDGEGGMVVPGFIDAHVHFLDGGRTLAEVQLRDAASREEFTRRVAEFVSTSEPGEWITGGTWDHQNWGGELPHRDWLDAISPDNPVWLMRLDGHMGVANSLALKLAGIDADTPDMPGGEIVRDANGSPTGVIKDNPMRLVVDAIPAPSQSQLDGYLEAAMHYVASNGITTVHDMFDGTSNSWANLETYRRAESNDALITRIYAMTPLAEWQRLRDYVTQHGRGSDWVKFGGLKGFMDGSLGSNTAAMLEPFTDTPDDRGFLLDSLDDIKAWVSGADSAGLHVNVHAIGDKAIRDLLDIYFDVANENGPRDRRFRMEHAQHIHPDDVPRFAIQGVIASMQPYHAIDDGRWAENVIGPVRAKTTYAFKTLIDDGAHVAFGSDWYVAPASPLEGIYAAVTRRTLDGKRPEGWIPAEKISVEQALYAYTVEAAYASYDEDR
ncbi:MAG: amidohydrolase family protein, partial [Gammaproteobacteria bacterium]|nr:amidohydrolase family protein [Gammaproteobacteria bacterium]